MTRARDLARFANNQALSVDTDFDVGINSTSPAAKLDVRGDSFITGILTATSFSGNVTGDATGLSGTPNITVNNIVAAGATFSGVVTYEDVTNVDSVGIVTARTGVEVTANGLVVNAGVSTFAADLSIADKIVHTGDTNTAIRFPAADTFTVETSGSERLRVNSDGFLGIKTSSVLAPLHVYDASNNTMARLESGDATCRLQLKDNTGEGYVLATGDNLIFANTSSVTERLRIKSDGDVGIGTEDPIEKLHVFNRASSGGLIHYDGASNSHFGLRIRSNSDGGNFESDFANGTTAMLDLFADAGTVSGGDFLVCRSQAATPILLVKANGNVGINTASPTSTLDVEGTISDSIGDVRSIPLKTESSSSSYTLIASDAGKTIHVHSTTTTVVVPNSVFSAGDAVSIVNGDGSNTPTIEQGSGFSLRNTGDGSTGNRTLGVFGMATIYFTGAGVGYISGSGMT